MWEFPPQMWGISIGKKLTFMLHYCDPSFELNSPKNILKGGIHPKILRPSTNTAHNMNASLIIMTWYSQNTQAVKMVRELE